MLLTGKNPSIRYNLNCATGISGQIQITVTGNVTYNGIAPGTLTQVVSGNVFTYTIADFGTINNQQDFGLLFTTDTTAQAGDVICINTAVTPVSGDNNTSNNTYQFCYQVILLVSLSPETGVTAVFTQITSPAWAVVSVVNNKPKSC